MKIKDPTYQLITSKISFYNKTIEDINLQLECVNKEMELMEDDLVPWNVDRLNNLTMNMTSLYHELVFFRGELNFYIKLMAN